jgi:hypothetical protein
MVQKLALGAGIAQGADAFIKSFQAAQSANFPKRANEESSRNSTHFSLNLQDETTPT